MPKDSQIDPKDVREEKSKGAPSFADDKMDGESRNPKKQSGERNDV